MTHINAFYGAVDEAKAELKVAQGKVEAAENALKAHPDYKEELAPLEEEPKKDNKVKVSKESKK